MGKVILQDGNNLAIRCIHSQDVIAYNKDKTVSKIDYDYWKFLVLSSIYKSLFTVKGTSTYVFAIDSKNSWRYDVWHRYKEDRKLKKKKDKTQFPWDEFFEHYNALAAEIKENLPVKVLQIDKCEGDDIIGVIALNETKQCEIISTDKDYLQLYSDRVKIYNPMKQKHVSHPDTKIFLFEQCLCGQTKDSIFNIKTPLDHPVGKRKPGFGPKAFEKVVIYGGKKWLEDNDLVDRYMFNSKLMDFRQIPTEIKQSILEEYNTYKYPEPGKIWEYVEKCNYPEIIENFNQIEEKFLQLY